mmetsp:Transcript_60563/g.177064  ORF Transcript_60563/g.177064 Transcript_60563/m.177064 type:complete len:207 (-) Transcript_60563:990-1610(-)
MVALCARMPESALAHATITGTSCCRRLRHAAACGVGSVSGAAPPSILPARFRHRFGLGGAKQPGALPTTAVAAAAMFAVACSVACSTAAAPPAALAPPSVEPSSSSAASVERSFLRLLRSDDCSLPTKPSWLANVAGASCVGARMDTGASFAAEALGISGNAPPASSGPGVASAHGAWTAFGGAAACSAATCGATAACKTATSSGA